MLIAVASNHPPPPDFVSNNIPIVPAFISKSLYWPWNRDAQSQSVRRKLMESSSQDVPPPVVIRLWHCMKIWRYESGAELGFYLKKQGAQFRKYIWQPQKKFDQSKRVLMEINLKTEIRVVIFLYICYCFYQPNNPSPSPISISNMCFPILPIAPAGVY